MKKLLIFIALFVYVVSPIDFVPGVLIDDAIVVLVGVLASRKRLQ
ncbi:MAG: hypothetical protein RSC06_16045 [Clostridia bacterium]